MGANPPFYGQLWQSFWRIAKPYWFSEKKWQARGWLALLVAFLLGFNAINVLISYVMRDLMTALAEKQLDDFFKALALCLAVFVVYTPTSALFGYVGRRLGVHWRQWLTERFLARYFDQRAYYRIGYDQDIDNPDQRIAQDINAFTATSLDLLTLVLNSVIQLLAFIGVLWSISQSLVWALIAYAILGTGVTALFGRRLIHFNFLQLRREADLRYGLVHVRDNAESIAFYRGEAQEAEQIDKRLRQAIGNSLKLIGWERNLAFFTQGYQSVVQILPLAVIAPLYFSDQVQFGVMSQAAMAFTQVLAALTIIVTQFERLSQFAAGVARLQAFDAALDKAAAAGSPGTQAATEPAIALQVDSRLGLAGVTLHPPGSAQVLLRETSLTVPSPGGMLIAGASGVGKSSLLRAIAGLWSHGSGRIHRPPLEDMMFLPQRPYMVLGSLRQQLLYPRLAQATDDGTLREALARANLADLPERVGGFDAVLEWGQLLSLGEQQRLAFARLLLSKPAFAILDEATSALDADNEARLYEHLVQSGITFVSVGHRPTLVRFHQNVLVLSGQGQWRLVSAEAYLARDAATDAAALAWSAAPA